MSFPHTYTGRIFYKGRKQDLHILEKNIRDDLAKMAQFEVKQENNTTLFQSSSPFLKIPFAFSLDINTDEIVYTLQLQQTLKIILFVLIFTALFSYNSLSFFFWFASLFTITFYTVNLLIINGVINQTFVKILEKRKLYIPDKEHLSAEQKEWLKDKNRCPACGYFLSSIDLTCPECDLQLNRKRKDLPLDTAKYQDLPVKYHLKKN